MNNFLKKVLYYGTFLSTVALIISVLIQVYARFFLPSAPVWTEEASRLFFIYGIAFAAGLAMESREYIALDWFYEKLPNRIQKSLQMLIPLVCLVLFGLMCIYSIPFVELGLAESSPGLKIKMSWAFFSLIILSASMSYFSWRELVGAIKNKRHD